MHENLRKQVSQACNDLYRRKLCGKDGGSVSAYDRRCGVILIKPAGVRCQTVTPIDVIAATPDGMIIEGEGALPADYATHLELYKALPHVTAIAFANPPFSTAFAQAGKPVKPYGTTHAQYFGDAVPCTRRLAPSEIENDYPVNLGRLIVETLREDPPIEQEVEAVLVNSDGAYCMDETPAAVVDRMEALEEVAKLAFHTELLMRGGQTGGTRMQEDLLRYCYEHTHAQS